jgi:hypothetical protein
MDYWCALWFWPLDQARLLPSRDEWLLELSFVLGDIESVLEGEEGQLQLLPDTQPKQLAVDFSDRHGHVNKTKLLEDLPRLKLVEATATQLVHKTKPRRDVPVSKKSSDAAVRFMHSLEKAQRERIQREVNLIQLPDEEADAS